MPRRFPKLREFKRGVREYEKREPREAVYWISEFVVSKHWGDAAKMADGLIVFLLSWNQATYRYGGPNPSKLEKWLKDNLRTISSFRRRYIFSLKKDDHDRVVKLFSSLLESLKVKNRRGGVRRSPVGTAKALHILAPEFFPLWDVKIAKAHRCYWYNSKKSAEKYWEFCLITKEMSERFKGVKAPKGKTLVKLIDMYNYARYTGGWI